MVFDAFILQQDKKTTLIFWWSNNKTGDFFSILRNMLLNIDSILNAMFYSL